MLDNFNSELKKELSMLFTSSRYHQILLRFDEFMDEDNYISGKLALKRKIDDSRR